MYRYDEFDRKFVNERVAEFRGQVARRMSGELSEEEFRPLRLMNGLYLQLHAYMLRVAIPYGTFSAVQMRKLAQIARTYDRGYGHFTTRQNIQFNWPKLEDVPNLLAELADVEMHAIQTSGNCIRNVTADPYAGAVVDEFDDSRSSHFWAANLKSLFQHLIMTGPLCVFTILVCLFKRMMQVKRGLKYGLVAAWAERR